MRVLITRPWRDGAGLAAALRAHGVDSIIAPLLNIHYWSGPPLDLHGVQSLLVTSANGVRALAAREPTRDLPVYAVGDATARTARRKGFQVVESASGDVAALAKLVRDKLDPAAGALVHVAGTQVAGNLAGMLTAAGFQYRREVLYEAHIPDRLPPTAARAVKEQTLHGVVMYSPRTAATFVDLIRKAELENECQNLRAFCLSQAVADQAGAVSWKSILVVAHPAQSAMVEAVTAVDK